MAPEPSITLPWNIDLDTRAATEQLARDLADLWRPPARVVLTGDLGAGKTTLIQGVLHHWGVSGPVKSPTFDLVHLYRLSTVTVYHVDLYRLTSPAELAVLDLPGPDEDGTVVLAEWGAALAAWYPDRFECHLAVKENGGRRLTLSAQGRPKERLAAWVASRMLRKTPKPDN